MQVRGSSTSPLVRRTRRTGAGVVLAVAAAGCGTGAPNSPVAASGSPASGPATTRSSQPAGATVSLARAAVLGRQILVAADGRTLYLFAKDAPGRSTCTGSCLAAWPPLTVTGRPGAGPGITPGLLGTFTRSDGRSQVTYHGHPLYYYAGDSAAGQVNGQGLEQFGARWYVVAAGGEAVTTAGRSAPAGGYGGSGY